MFDKSLRETSEGIILRVKVKPNSKEFKLTKQERILLLEVRSPPFRNRANTEIMKELGRLFRREVKILKGFKSREKLILIKDATSKEISKFLQHI
jgi:uncharacterized protein (TIGR00251 family)